MLYNEPDKYIQSTVYNVYTVCSITVYCILDRFIFTIYYLLCTYTISNIQLNILYLII